MLTCRLSLTLNGEGHLSRDSLLKPGNDLSGGGREPPGVLAAQLAGGIAWCSASGSEGALGEATFA
jgi:hypothetical protein